MGFFFFLSVVVGGNLLLKAYKLRVHARGRFGEDRSPMLQRQIDELRQELARRDADEGKRLSQLEEVVFFSDFELKRTFSKLESELKENQRS